MSINKDELEILINALITEIQIKEINAVRQMESDDREKVLRGEIPPAELKPERQLLERLRLKQKIDNAFPNDAEWVQTGEHDEYGRIICECSNCGHKIKLIIDKTDSQNYCPCCGAKMKGDEK